MARLIETRSAPALRAFFRPLRPALLLAFVFCLFACSGGTGHVKGTASYRERIALPQDAVFEAELIDLSGGAPRVIASSGVQAADGVPISFAITFRNNQIDAGTPYAVRAEIRSQARTLFTTPEPVPVLTEGHGRKVDLILKLNATSADVAEIARSVVAIEDKLGSRKRIEGALDDGEGPPVTWIAFLDGAEPVKIIAQSANGMSSTQAASFHFSGGALVHCASDAQMEADPSAGLDAPLAVSFDLYFQNGRFAGGTKTTNGIVGEPDEHEVRAFGHEAERLRAAVLARTGGH